jgi:uncharacterized protein YjbI with pentapeptide repeats
VDRVSDNPCGRPHAAHPAQISAFEASTETPTACDEDIHDLWLQHARVLELELDRAELTDLRLEDCDVSGIVATGSVVRRMELARTRVRGATFVKGQIEDTFLSECSTTELSFRFSRLKRMIFRGCDLAGADFYNTTFDHVTFEDCDLQRATFDAAIVDCLSIRNCNLAGVQGVSGLKGAQLDASDLPAMAISLAVDAGIKVRDA